jgi:hypothetical protein
MILSADSYEHLPTNAALSGFSAVYAFFFAGLDPVVTGFILPIALFAIGKTVDVLVKIFLEKRDKKPER